MSATDNCSPVPGAGREMTFDEICADLRTDINRNAARLKSLMCHSGLDGKEEYIGQHGEMRANIMLAYRHLEDARMRVGKILQAAGDGVSILDK